MKEQTYQEQLSMARTEKIRQMLKALPSACTDFINDIRLVTTPLTRMAYVIDLSTFCKFASLELPRFSNIEITAWTDEDWAAVTIKHLLTYVDYLTLYYKENSDIANQVLVQNHESGIMRKLSSLRSFFGFMFRNERIPANTADLISLPKLHEKPILFLSENEVEELLKAVRDGDSLSDTQKKYHKITEKRDYAIIMLFLGTGMRVSECVSINIEDLDLDNNAVLVTRKGGNQVILYFPDEVKTALSEYLEQREQTEAAEGHEHALFLSIQKKRISQRSVEIMVKKFCHLVVPLKKRMSPHKLRSTYATRLYHETDDIYLVADALGHSDVNTTRKHYAAMSDGRRRQAAKNVHFPSLKKQDE